MTAKDAEPCRKIGLQRPARERAGGHADHFTVSLQSEEGVALGESEQRAVRGGAETAGAPHGVQRLRVPAEGQRSPRACPLGIAPATETGGRNPPLLLHLSSD
ncbi:MAG TPA: hypothetical protein VML54_06565 [Candidatus Limnocylindrales bacterium]|nr:hypothetical protein [Candidatus Limnocylindrales bacterium]